MSTGRQEDNETQMRIDALLEKDRQGDLGGERGQTPGYAEAATPDRADGDKHDDAPHPRGRTSGPVKNVDRDAPPESGSH